MLPPYQADSLLKVSGITRDNVELARYPVKGCASSFSLTSCAKLQRLGESLPRRIRGVSPGAPHGPQAGAETQEGRVQEWNQVRVGYRVQ